jgi:hypothetical protein
MGKPITFFFTENGTNPILFILVRTEADRIGSSSPREFADVGVSLVGASLWRCGAWFLVPLASHQQGRVHSASR